METSSLDDKQICSDIFYALDFEKIVDHPNILIAARFWEDERYNAAKVCYKFMRAIDDLVDNYKTDHKVISENERLRLKDEVNRWISSVMDVSSMLSRDKAKALMARMDGVKGLAGIQIDELEEIVDTMLQFHVPLWPFEAFARSMVYDIYHDGFPTLEAFLDYSAGASVAPASIFVHLCGLRRVNGVYQAPSFDVKKVATPCAIFSYLVHIIRDFVKDHTNNLNYFPLDLMVKYNLNRENLLRMARGSEPVTPGFRKMVAELYAVADEYRLKTLETMQEIEPYVETRSRLSLRIIFDLYSMIFERIDIENGSFTTSELNPTPEEIKKRVRSQIEIF